MRTEQKERHIRYYSAHGLYDGSMGFWHFFCMNGRLTDGLQHRLRF